LELLAIATTGSGRELTIGQARSSSRALTFRLGDTTFGCSADGRRSSGLKARQSSLKDAVTWVPPRCTGGLHECPVLGHSRFRGQARSNYAPLWWQHIVRGDPKPRWHPCGPRLWDWRSRIGTLAHVRRRAQLQRPPDDHPHPLGSHPGIPLLRATLCARQYVGYLRAGCDRTATGTDPGRTDGVQLLSRYA